MRIISGSAAGRYLKVPKGFDVRPTPDLVRQAIFNSLGSRVEQSNVLDLFSGTGALGLECLSRGARSVLSIEKSPRHARILKQNQEETDLPAEQHEIRIMDVYTALAQLVQTPRKFDLVMADPPYGEKNIGKRSESMAQQLLDDPHLPQLMAPEGLFFLGHTRRDTLTLPDTWHEKKILKHGDSWFRILTLPG